METLMILVFIAGYAAIAFEHKLGVNKAASALLTGVVMWTVHVSFAGAEEVPEWFALKSGGEHGLGMALHYLIEGRLLEMTGEVAGILFFLLGAMTIVELMDSHQSFGLVTSKITTQSVVKLIWMLGGIAFPTSAVLDNMTTTILMCAVCRKLIGNKELRWTVVGLVIIAANAGGAWTVIGDITTTMLWIGGKITPWAVTKELILPSIACLMVPVVVLSTKYRGKKLSEFPADHRGDGEGETVEKRPPHPFRQWLFLCLGVGGLLSVPVFKTVTHLPPFMGMMLALSVIWVVSEVIDSDADERTKSETGVLAVLKRLDHSTVFFFLGILLAVGALGSAGVLTDLAALLNRTVGDTRVVTFAIGLTSAVVDNVPLVAAGIKMYDFPVNHPFWMQLAYTAGTGGSCLIIGSAAGVAAMGIENITFGWYLRKIAPLALLGYVAGYVVCLFTT